MVVGFPEWRFMFDIGARLPKILGVDAEPKIIGLLMWTDLPVVVPLDKPPA